MAVALTLRAREAPGETLHAQAPAADEVWAREDSPHVIRAPFTIPEGITVRIEAGAQVLFDRAASMLIRGRLAADGREDAPVRFAPVGFERRGGLSFEGAGSGGLIHCRFERGSMAAGSGRAGVVNAYQATDKVALDHCEFKDWSGTAVEAYFSPDVTVRDCYFGEGFNEAVHTYASPVLVENCVFGRRFGYNDGIDATANRRPEPVPVIRGCVFLGGDDDAIDLDDCDALAEGNLIQHFRGGDHDPIGISGDRTSRPVLVNNLIVDCETGIGFKNGPHVIIVNNTIVNCDRGVWLHQGPTTATMFNTIIWGSAEVAVRLEPDSSIEVSHSILDTPEAYPGEGNGNADPMFRDSPAGDYRLSPGSPAIDAGLGADPAPAADFDGNPRTDVEGAPNNGAGEPPFVDIGAFEYRPAPSAAGRWRLLD